MPISTVQLVARGGGQIAKFFFFLIFLILKKNQKINYMTHVAM